MVNGAVTAGCMASNKVMQYCFMKHRRSPDEDGWEPDFPGSITGRLMLADARESKWGLWQYVDEQSSDWRPEHPAGEALVQLLESGTRYPPALALARAEAAEICKGPEATIDDLERSYSTAVRHHLARQHEVGYVLAMALQGDGIDLCQGEWYWVVGVDSATVSWVSADFFVYRSSIAAFDLTGAQLKCLP